MNILITGSTGFIGSALSTALAKHHTLQKPSRAKVGNLLPSNNWIRFLGNVEVVIHLAARAHIMKDDSVNQLEEYRKVNTFSAINLARQAVEVGVRRFIFN